MDNLDESENTAKISDSAYSNSCSNSQSRRSHSSKSTHSGSNSSGSSGYGGKPSTSGYSNNLNQTPEKRSKDKETKKKKVELEITEAESEPECRPVDQVLEFEETKEDLIDVDQTSPSAPMVVEKGAESMDISTSDRNSCKDEESELSPLTAINSIADCPAPTSTYYADSFSCVISMHDGVIMYTTSSLTTSLGYPKDMWVGRPFLDFVHPRDRNIFASQISTGLGAPRNVDGMEVKVISQGVSTTSIVCRIRRYRGLSTGFGVKERVVTFVPFLLKLSFKNMAESDSDAIYLVLQAALFQSAFKTPNEPVSKPIPFVIRHSAKGALEYIDPESVPYLGYMPQDLMSKDALQLYHPHDLDYLQDIYEIIVREGGVAKSDPYRLLAQNGDYVKLESEFSSFVNPWSKKVEFVIGKHYILQGPTNPDVFETVDANTLLKLNDEEISRARGIRENMYRILNNLLTKPAETAKQQMTKHCDELSAYLDTFPEDSHKHDDDLRIDVHDAGHNYYERDSVMLGGISPHNDYHDSKYGPDTPISYNQLNYNENLQRYFDSHQPYVFEDRNTVNRENVKDPKGTSGDSLYPYERYDFNEMGSLSKSDAMANSTSAPLVNSDYIPLKLTEALLSRHNAEMEYELVKLHRKNRSSSRGDRERNYETRRKKKEHLARCNASFYPTDAATLNSMLHTHGVKRPSKPTEPEPCSHKHHCPSHSNRRWTSNAAASNAPTATQAAPWSTTPVNNSFILGVDVPQVPMVSHVSPIPGMIPMYYAPPTPAPRHLHANHGHASIGPARYQSPTMPCMMYGHPVYGSPMLYSPIGPPVTYAMPHGFVPPNVPCGNTTNAVGLSTRNYQELIQMQHSRTVRRCR